MAIVFDPVNKRVILDSTNVTATELYSRSVDWLALSDNSKYGAIFRQVGGDDLGSSLSIPPYFFLQNGWRIRPMETNHNLVVTGNLFVEGGGVPVVNTLGQFQINVNYTVPVLAQAYTPTGSSGGTGGTGASAADIWSYSSRSLTTTQPTASEIANSVWTHTFVSKLLTVAKFLGLK
jgi:hypothetical protein